MKIGYETLDDVMVRQFTENPEFADFYLSEILKDGDDYEIQRVRYWYDEAKARSLEPAVMA